MQLLIKLPANIISIHRTSNQKQLAEIYSVADVFLNPTGEEMFGMVSIESLLCGTPVVNIQNWRMPGVS
ncbi:glycosyltransferase [Congzhengia minquanensis]|uniref:Glycosyltransferase n=1 Tax=Congzhengia minquanensis TaxID=2763657 RepID=A0A926HWW1_9FIRM|nr:glycosyltransferase [Congzhengia minquanensis]